MKAPLPAGTEEGEILAIIGTGLLVPVTLNTWALEVPPPGPGFVTVTLKEPELLISDAGMNAVSCVEEMKVVDLADPLKLTLDPELKLLPFTVNVNAPLPAVIDDGLIELTVGFTLYTVNV